VTTSKTSFFTWLWRWANPFYHATSARKLEPKPQRRPWWALLLGRTTPRRILVPAAQVDAPVRRRSWFARRDVPLTTSPPKPKKNESTSSSSEFSRLYDQLYEDDEPPASTARASNATADPKKDEPALLEVPALDDDSDDAVDRAILESALDAARLERDAALEAALEAEALVAELRSSADKARNEAQELRVRVDDSDAEVRNFRKNYALRDAQLDDAVRAAKRDADAFAEAAAEAAAKAAAEAAKYDEQTRTLRRTLGRLRKSFLAALVASAAIAVAAAATHFAKPHWVIPDGLFRAGAAATLAPADHGIDPAPG